MAMGEWSDERPSLENSLTESGSYRLEALLRRRWLRGATIAAAWVAAGLWLPFAWLVLVDHPWNGYRWFWIQSWPILPGFIAGLPFYENEPRMFAVMGLAAAGLFAFLVWLGAPGGWRRVLAVGLALCASVPASLASWTAFRG